MGRLASFLGRHCPTTHTLAAFLAARPNLHPATTLAVLRAVPAAGELVEKVEDKKKLEEEEEVMVKKSVPKAQVKQRGLQRCGTCGLRVAAARLLQHLCIHHKAELEADYGPAILANQCGLCTFASRSATDSKKKYAMVKHIGAVHGKVLDYAKD